MKSNKQCLDLVLDAMKELSDGTEACLMNQAPRSCLKTHEDAIFACGGKDGNKTLCYLPSKDKWYKMADLHIERNCCSLTTAAYQGKLYVIGGDFNFEEDENEGEDEAEDEDVHTVERYDPLLNSWVTINCVFQTSNQVCCSCYFPGVFICHRWFG